MHIDIMINKLKHKLLTNVGDTHTLGQLFSESLKYGLILPQ